MYDEREILILQQNVGIEGKDSFIPKGSELIFIKAIDNKSNLSKSMVVIQFGDKQLALPELAVAPKEDKTIDILKEFNIALMKANPSLRIYHHNKILRKFHTIMLAFTRMFITPLINIKNKLLAPVAKIDKSTEDKLVAEIKALMEEK